MVFARHVGYDFSHGLRVSRVLQVTGFAPRTVAGFARNILCRFRAAAPTLGCLSKTRGVRVRSSLVHNIGFGFRASCRIWVPRDNTGHGFRASCRLRVSFII